MKFSTIDGLPFEDPTWIAGVEDTENMESNNEDSNPDNDSESNEN